MPPFKDVIAEYQPVLARVAASYERNEALQQELMQEITLAIWQALPRFTHQSSLKTYVLKIAHNRAVTHVVQQTRHKDIVDDSETPLETFTDTKTPSPEQSSSQEQQIIALVDAVRRLPIKSRQVITLSLEGLSYQEISEVTGMNSNAVGVTLNRAKQQVKQGLNHD